jgi:hypothetical protein
VIFRKVGVHIMLLLAIAALFINPGAGVVLALAGCGLALLVVSDEISEWNKRK